MVKVTYSNVTPYYDVIKWCCNNIGPGGYGYFDPKAYITENDIWVFVYDINCIHFYFRCEEDAVLFKLAWL